MFDKRQINKMNIISIITCFILIFIFVFGCIDFAKADSDSDISNGSLIIQIKRDSSMQEFIWSPSAKGEFCGVANTSSPHIATLVSLESFNISQIWNVYKYDGGDDVHQVSSLSSYYAGDLYRISTGSMYDSSIKDFIVSGNFLIFATDKDAYNYLTTGVINNLVYDNRPIEYDSSIEIPLMAQCQTNGDKFLFNCKQSESHNDYKLQISASVSLTPVYSNLTSKQYADTQQIYTSSKSEIGKYDNFDTAFNVSFSSTDLLNGLDTSRSALGFKEFYNGYNILLPYKESVLSKIYFYARNVSGIKCSNWVKVTYDLIAETSTYEEVESVAGSDVPSDTKKDSSESYPDDYIYNDNEPAQDSNSSGIIGYIKSGLGLVGNNSIIALIGNTFSFLPKELTTLLLFGGALLVAVGIIKVVTR